MTLENNRGEGLTVNHGVFELPCWNMVVEQQVNFTKGTIFGLGKAVPAPDVAYQVRAGVEETSFSSPVPG